MFGRFADAKFLSVVVCALSLLACSSDGDVQTGKQASLDGGVTDGASSAGGASSVGGASSGGSSGNSGAAGAGGALGTQCTTTLDCPQTDCFGCPQLVCVNGLCVSSALPGSGGARP